MHLFLTLPCQLLPQEYEGYGLVVNTLGEVFIKELALERSRLADEFLGEFLVGEWIFLRARRSRDEQSYKVVFAHRFPNDVEGYSALRTALTPDGKIAVCLRTQHASFDP